MNYIIPIYALLFCFAVWFRYGRDGKGRGVVIAEYEPPLHLSPAEVGLLLDYEVTQREITATIIDLAVRGFIGIRRVEKKKFLGSHQVFEFVLKRDDVLELRNYEKELLNGLFGVVGAQFTAKVQASIKDPVAKKEALTLYPAGGKSLIGSTVSIDELKPYFYTYVGHAKIDVYNRLVSDGYFKANPLYGGYYFIPASVLCLIFGFLIVPQYKLGLTVSAAVFIFFSLFMNARTTKGQRAKEVVDGLALYLKTAELDSIKMTQGPKNAQSHASMLDIYDAYLPYAIAVGLEDEWVKRFEGAFNEPTAEEHIATVDVPLIVDSVETATAALKTSKE